MASSSLSPPPSLSSSSSSCFHETKYDVFISFRGEDIRSSFLSHLVKELRDNQIDAYVDERLHSGDDVSSALLQAIQESSISLVIFSQHYASSKWCLDELVKIIECMEQHQQAVIPVFYNVDPSDVRYQKRTFEEAFNKHQDNMKGSTVKVQSWRSALKKAANLSGFRYQSKYENEFKLIDGIVKAVLNKLNHMFSFFHVKGLVGIDEHVKCIESLLAIESREVRIVGIWGMGGIGKTTIAAAVFDKYCSQYEACCFLSDAREVSQTRGTSYLSQKLSELLQEQNIPLYGPAEARPPYVKKRALVVLDDVDSSYQLEHLIGEQICLGPGSRVIITTRDRQILEGVHEIYEIQGLNFENALQLFCWNAFCKLHPEIGYEKLSKKVVGYANGVPLALQVLGSHLRSRSEKEWEHVLSEFKRPPPQSKILDILKLSFDGLDDSEKNIFLDIACFLKGQDKDNTIRLLDSSGFSAATGIDNLQCKSLIKISNHNKIEMHDLIVQMGLEIVRQESIKDPSKRSRLWNPEDVYDVLKNNKGTELVEGIMLDLSETRDLCLHVDTFKKMQKLRFLRFHASSSQGLGNVYIPTELESFSDELRYLEWSGYPSKSLPSTFCAENLLELHMPNSQVCKLWDGVQDLVNLKEIDLRGSVQLEEIPDLTRAPNLKKIDLSFCISLCRVHPSILSIHTLEELYLQYCTKLKSLKGEIHFKSLRYLEVHGCSSLKEFSVSSEELRELSLAGTKINKLQSSIGRLSKLEGLYLADLRLKSPLNELCFLTSLEKLCLSRCKEVMELPHNIKALLHLAFLDLSGCCKLQSLPELPPSIVVLDATNCTSLQEVFSVKAVSSSNRMCISFANCTRLDEQSLYGIMEDAHDTLVRTAISNLFPRATDFYKDWVLRDDRGKVWYPGSQVPKWFKYQTRRTSLSVELDQPDQILGFFLCCVIPYVPSDKKYHGIECQYYVGGGEGDISKNTLESIEVYEQLNLDHVLIWYDLEESILIGITKSRVNDDFITYNQKISLEFIIESHNKYEVEVGPEEKQKVEENVNFAETLEHDCLVKGCGICPLYVSDIQNFMRKMDVELECVDKYKEYRESVLSKLESLMSSKMEKQPIS